jgi:hypothetical protein
MYMSTPNDHRSTADPYATPRRISGATYDGVLRVGRFTELARKASSYAQPQISTYPHDVTKTPVAGTAESETADNGGSTRVALVAVKTVAAALGSAGDDAETTTGTPMYRLANPKSAIFIVKAGGVLPRPNDDAFCGSVFWCDESEVAEYGDGEGTAATGDSSTFSGFISARQDEIAPAQNN